MFKGLIRRLRYEKYFRQYKKHRKEYEEGKGFPYFLYPRSLWPAPFYKFVPEEKLLGVCSNCGMEIYFDLRNRFSRYYSCIYCYCWGAIPPSLRSEVKISLSLIPFIHRPLCKN